MKIIKTADPSFKCLNHREVNWEMQKLCCRLFKDHTSHTLSQYRITHLPSLKARDYQHDSKKINAWKNLDPCLIVSNSISIRNGKSSRKLNVFAIKMNIKCLKYGQIRENHYVGKTVIHLTHLLLSTSIYLFCWQKRHSCLCKIETLKRTSGLMSSYNKYPLHFGCRISISKITMWNMIGFNWMLSFFTFSWHIVVHMITLKIGLNR